MSLALIAPTIAPFTGFGNDPAGSVKFGIRRLNGRHPGWDGGDADLTFHRVRNSDLTGVQNHGRLPRTMTARLWFATQDDLELMDSLVGTMQTLRYRWGLTPAYGGTRETRDQVEYLVLPDTLLVSLDDRDTPTGRRCEATATFWRAYSAAHYLGFVELQEES
jgi:hypothetical protein